MPSDDAKSFLDAVDQDPELRAKLNGALDQIVQTAKENGYNFDANDLRDELRNRWGMSNPPNYHENPQTCFFA
jgi:predicted ribosomally synthesized peptide with nif11-like leader